MASVNVFGAAQRDPILSALFETNSLLADRQGITKRNLSNRTQNFRVNNLNSLLLSKRANKNLSGSSLGSQVL